MARTRWRPSTRVLLAGDVTDLPDIAAVLAGLPDNAYGQVFVEAALPEDVRHVPAPARVTVTWLLRCSRPSQLDALVFADHGEALAAALLAWAGEWLTDDESDHGSGADVTPTRVWIGCGASPWVERARTVLHDLEPAATAE
jgi:NADPH-dependent ferric siderophore reductase